MRPLGFIKCFISGLLCISATLAWGQLPPSGCGNTIPTASTAPEVVPLCAGLDALNEYCFTLQPATCPVVNGNFPGCDSAVGRLDNPNWFAFVAGDTLISMEIEVANCRNPNPPNGVQLGFYEATADLGSIPECNATNLPLETVRSSGLPECGPACVIGQRTYSDIPTSPGKTYYLVFDGCLGDTCDIIIKVLAGGAPLPIPAAEQIDFAGGIFMNPVNEALDTVCTGALNFPIHTRQVDNASSYLWTLPDGRQQITNDTLLLFDFPDAPGAVFTFCVQGRNDCDTAAVIYCDSVLLVDLDTISSRPIFLCASDSAEWMDIQIGPFLMLTRDTALTFYEIDTFESEYYCHQIAEVVVNVLIDSCDCFTESGAVIPIPTIGCVQDTLHAVYQDMNLFLEPDDSLRFVVHTLPGNLLGEIKKVLAQPSLSFDSTIFNCGETYYLSVVAGPWINDGFDLTSPCLDVSVGTPMRFDCIVNVSAGMDTMMCADELILTATSSIDTGVWTSLSTGVRLTSLDSLRAHVLLPNAGSYLFEFHSQSGNCESRDTLNVVQHESPTIIRATIDTTCNGNNDAYIVSFTIQGGDNASYQVNGNLIGSDQFTSNEIPSGTSFIFRVTDANDCSIDSIHGIFDCPCLSEVGDLSFAHFDLCKEDTFRVAEIYDPTGQVILGMDARNYILCSDSTNPLQNIVELNQSGVFTFNSSFLTLGQPYFSYVIIGNEIVPDTVDILDPCLSMTSFVSVRWFSSLEPFSLEATNFEFSCDFQTIDLFISTNSDTTAYSILWTASDGGNIMTGQEALWRITIEDAGRYQATIQHEIAGCPAEAIIIVDQGSDLPVAQVAVIDTLSCRQLIVVVSGQSSTVGPNVTYLWTGPGIEGLDNEIDVQVSQPGLYTLVVRDTVANCEIDANVEVEALLDQPIAFATADNGIGCDPLGVLISGLGSSVGLQIVYQWNALSDDAHIVGVSGQRDVQVDGVGDYELIVLDLTSGCQSLDTVSVLPDSNDIQSASVVVMEPSCDEIAEGGISIPTIVGGVGPFSYSYDGGATFSADSVGSQLQAGNYDVVVRDANGCEYTESVVLHEPLEFGVDLGEDQQVEVGYISTIIVETDLPDSLIGSIVWDPLVDGANQHALIQRFGPQIGYQPIMITITSINGCAQTSVVGIIGRFVGRVYAPNVMRPSSVNEENQQIQIFGDLTSVENIFSFQIFNRWGERVFERGEVPVDPNYNPAYAWDGTIDGEEAPQGVYVYAIELEFKNGKKKVVSGDFILLRD